VAAAEQVDQTVPGDGFGADGGGTVERFALVVQQVAHSTDGFAEVVLGGW
jgi:hypothetical protein